MKEPQTPQCERFAEPDVQGVRNFLAWLQENGYHIQGPENSRATTPEDLLYDWAEIDYKELDKERRALLEYQRHLNRERENTHHFC